MKALVTGCSGQDGSYLCELLLEKGYEVHGILRRSSSLNTARIDHIFDDLHLHYGDLTDAVSLNNIMGEVSPDETYGLAAQSHVGSSFKIPIYTAMATGLGTLNLLEAVRRYGNKFYQASSSEMFGSAPAPQSEETPFHPRSPYGVSKVFSYWATVNYREAYDMYASNGILFNHESPRRGDTFVTKKIVKAAVRILNGKQDKLILGNLTAQRDWGYAPDFVEAMWMMLQQSKPDDYVIATGATHSVKDFLDETFSYLGLNWRNYVMIDAKYFRPTEVDVLLGDASKARRVLGWTPKTDFSQLVRIMVEAELHGESK